MSGFNDIIGQEKVISHFRGAIKLNKVSHAYILNGEAGTGKKMMARAFSMTMQCEKKEDNPCMECRSCKQALTDNNPDIRWVVHEKPATISVEEIRTQINNDIQIKPYSNEYKIYIVDEAEKLNVAAQNALLKTIEEPPGYAVILLLANNKETLLQTILSRCVTLEMKLIKPDVIRDYLIKNEKIVDYRANEVSQFAGGNIGKAIKLAHSEDFIELKNSVVSLAKGIDKMTVTDMAAAVKKVSTYKDNISEYIDLLELWYRDILLYKAGQNKEIVTFKEEINVIKACSEKLSYKKLEKIMEALEGVKSKLRLNVNFDMLIELLFLTLRD